MKKQILALLVDFQMICNASSINVHVAEDMQEEGGPVDCSPQCVCMCSCFGSCRLGTHATIWALIQTDSLSGKKKRRGTEQLEVRERGKNEEDCEFDTLNGGRH